MIYGRGKAQPGLTNGLKNRRICDMIRKEKKVYLSERRGEKNEKKMVM